MKFPFSLVCLLFIFPAYRQLNAQGCSDAGVCSVGSLSIIQFRFEELPTDKTTLKRIEEKDVEVKFTKDGKQKDSSILVTVGDSSKKTVNNDLKATAGDSIKKKQDPDLKYVFIFPKYQFHFNMHYGSGERGTNIFIPTFEANFQLVKSKLFTQIKVPYSFINGDLAKMNGLGDITGSFSYIVFNKLKHNLVFTLGGKIPTNNSDLKVDSLPLPMPYQTSLGSYDLLLGAKYTFKKWDFVLGYQHSFNANENSFLHYSFIPEDPSNRYFESKNMQRGDDGIFRVNRNFKYKRSSTSLGLLFIQHLTQDEITNATGERFNPMDSDGLTLNVNVAGVYPISKSMEITFVAGGPIVNRAYRTDGLTRKFVIIPGLRWNLF